MKPRSALPTKLPSLPMVFNKMKYKKPIYPVNAGLVGYLRENTRNIPLPIAYNELMRYDAIVPILDDDGDTTHWNSVLYSPSELEDVKERLVHVYQLLIADGGKIDYLDVASVDYCAYGNSQPFRIKIRNQINDNHDYYYIKKADASRIYGLELEHLLSPNKINYIHHGSTLVEEHIIGVPGDEFIKKPEAYGGHTNEVRLSKEFVKFNERCFAQLLGDMRAYNFVVVVNHDFDQVQYRLRSIDFDQQCYEGRSKIYLPQFYKENVKFVRFAQDNMSLETAEQYQVEERSLLRKRYGLAKGQLADLLKVMKKDRISKDEHVVTLRDDLAAFHGNKDMKKCNTMGEILDMHIKTRLGLDQ